MDLKRHTGVTYSRTEDRWLCRFYGWYIGRFRTFEEAVAARKGFEKALEIL
jgi:hypothetical protein